jgi:hypothetical protein
MTMFFFYWLTSINQARSHVLYTALHSADCQGTPLTQKPAVWSMKFDICWNTRMFTIKSVVCDNIFPNVEAHAASG